MHIPQSYSNEDMRCGNLYYTFGANALRPGVAMSNEKPGLVLSGCMTWLQWRQDNISNDCRFEGTLAAWLLGICYPINLGELPYPGGFQETKCAIYHL